MGRLIKEMSRNHHWKRLRSNFEIVCLMSVIVILGDFGWLVHDILGNGMSFVYGGVGLFLLTGLFGTMYILYKHNFSPFRRSKQKRSCKKRS